MRNSLVTVFVVIAVVATHNAIAGLPGCVNRLQEEANVFEVNCTLELDTCSVIGYLTHPKLKPGYHGLVANLVTKNERGPVGAKIRMLTYILRNGDPEVPSPLGYWAALQMAQEILLREKPSNLYYFDARTGQIVGRPNIKCVSLDKLPSAQ